MFGGVFFWVFLIEKKYPTKYTTTKKIHRTWKKARHISSIRFIKSRALWLSGGGCYINIMHNVYN
jgi:hypothetical protein